MVIVSEWSKKKDGNIKDLARNFLLYGALAEVFGRANGFNRGLGGSMHAFFTPFGILPNNAIVGGSADIAMGALYLRSATVSRHCLFPMSETPLWDAAQPGKR